MVWPICTYTHTKNWNGKSSPRPWFVAHKETPLALWGKLSMCFGNYCSRDSCSESFCKPRKTNQRHFIKKKIPAALNRIETASTISPVRRQQPLWIPSAAPQRSRKFRLSHYGWSQHVKIKINPILFPRIVLPDLILCAGQQTPQSLRLAVAVHYTPEGLSHLAKECLIQLISNQRLAGFSASCSLMSASCMSCGRLGPVEHMETVTVF